VKISRLFTAISFWLLGGTLNAAHCFFSSASPDFKNFKWHIIPAGAVHGLVLAAAAVILADLYCRSARLIRLTGVLLAGYLSGWVSGIFLGFSIEERWSLGRLWWPVRYGFSTEDSLMAPFAFFGLAGALYYLFLCVFKTLRDTRLSFHIAAAVFSGIAGSLWFWVSSKPWYFSPVHGAVWGICAGLGTWFLYGKKS
jgi:hypothetical protein